ncbi:MAG: hypothetical protein JW704_09825 [Anaerolineaceae bacterium]|nr:hypothetical protein [Anaerolineaceae bacterium]
MDPWDKGVTWKSLAAREAFAELIKIAGLEKSRLEDMITRDPKHSEYERKMLLINVSRSYQEAIGEAYNKAHEIELRAMGFHAEMVSAFGGE